MPGNTGLPILATFVGPWLEEEHSVPLEPGENVVQNPKVCHLPKKKTKTSQKYVEIKHACKNVLEGFHSFFHVLQVLA